MTASNTNPLDSIIADPSGTLFTIGCFKLNIAGEGTYTPSGEIKNFSIPGLPMWWDVQEQKFGLISTIVVNGVHIQVSCSIDNFEGFVVIHAAKNTTKPSI